MSGRQDLLFFSLFCVLHLWYDREPVSEVMQTNCGNINIVNEDAAFSSLNDAKQAVSQARFSSSSAANYANLNAKRRERQYGKCLSTSTYRAVFLR